MYSPFAHVAFWYVALGEGGANRPLTYPFGGPDALANEEPARRLAERLRQHGAEERKPLLRVLYGKASVLPWSALHPSWLHDVLTECRPQWRLWALDGLPPDLRAALEEGGPEAEAPSLLEGEVPGWWPAFFSAHVKERLGYPDLPPWETATHFPGRLWEQGAAELTRLLAFHGTRGLVSSLRLLPRPEASRLIGQVPPECQVLAQATVRNKDWSEDPFWPRIFQELESDSPDLTSRLFRAALADCVRAGIQQGQRAPLHRLAFRLPRDWGLWLRLQLEDPPAWTEMPVLPSLEDWQRRIEQLLRRPTPS